MLTILGADAGATRTTAAAADGAGRILARAESGPGAVRPGTADSAAEQIVRACLDALQRARREAPAGILVVGASGAGRESERLALEGALRRSGIAERVLVTTDAEIALAAAFGSGPGTVLIAGTGSVAWARLPDGSMLRAGGFGAVIGDPGSAHDLGREALRAAALALGGLGPETMLAIRLPARLGVSGDDLPRWAQAAPPSDVASLAVDLLDVAREGDVVARAIARRGAQALGRHVSVLASHFPTGPVDVAFGGSLLTRRKDYRRKVVTQVRRAVATARIRRAAADAVAGAIWRGVRVRGDG
jgi:N-acetylglucosamine kinase-like BadF-type ATPase